MHSNRRTWSRLPAILIILGLAFGLQINAPAQEATGKIIGAVTDQQAAVIPGAKVTVTNIATQVSRETVTDKEGNFQVLSLPLGAYRVTVGQQGFKKLISTDLTLQINQVLRVDPVLEVGGAAEVVEVSVQSSAVETVNPTLGQSVTSRPLLNLPLNGRNVLQLALLQPGVTESRVGAFSVAGGRGDSVTFLLDGGVNNNLLDNGVVFNPNPDTVAEFRILTSNSTAEFGRNGGGVVSVVTKSGTNQLHGSAFEFLRNDALNANTFFRNRDRLPKEILKRNQYGFTVGGPVFIPKVVNGKDRFFFFASYEGQRLVQNQSTAAVTVFTPAELKGDFSRSNAARTGPDTNVANFLQRFPFFQPNAQLAAQAIIDPSRINSVAQKFISANLVPTSTTGQLISTGKGQTNFDELTLKFDAVATAKDRFAVTLGTLGASVLNPFAFANAVGFPNTTTNHRRFANIAYTRVFSPTLLNEFRITAQRVNNFQAVPAAKLPTPAELGIATTPDHPTGPPQIVFGSGLSLGFSHQGPTALIDNTFGYTDALSWTRGKHNFKFGAGLTAFQDNTVYDFFVNGRFSFNSTARYSRNFFADFLLGLPAGYIQFPEAPSNIRTKSYNGFAQDEWHVTKRLTLSLGLRYEYSQPKLDLQGRTFSLSFGQQSTVFTKAPIGLVFPGDSGVPRGANFPDRNDWAPRFGFAWDPRGNGKTSIRGGVGVFYDILKGEDNLQFNGQAPFFAVSNLTFRALSANPSKEVNYLTQPYVAVGTPNPFPSRPAAQDVDFAAAGFLPIGDGGVFYVDPHLRTPYTYQYNLSIQRELMKDLTVEASYVGNSSHKLTSLVDSNPFIPGTLHRRFNTQPGTDDDTFSMLYEFRNVGTGNFNSLELSLQKRLADNRILGTTFFTLAYTYGHGIDTASGFRDRNNQVPAYNTKAFRASTDFDIRHRLTFSGGWDLPFDHWWAAGPKRLVKGWSLFPIVTYRTGFPLDIFAGFVDDIGLPGPSGAGDLGLTRANLVGNSVALFDPKLSQSFNSRQGNYWFNPANFTLAGLDEESLAGVTNPALRTYGSLPRNFFRAPSRTNFDLAVAKTTSLVGERLKAEFRAEFFNIFNAAQFNAPSTNINSRLFGQITTTADPRIIQFALRLTF